MTILMDCVLGCHRSGGGTDAIIHLLTADTKSLGGWEGSVHGPPRTPVSSPNTIMMTPVMAAVADDDPIRRLLKQMEERRNAYRGTKQWINQSAIARRIGMSSSYVSRLESGDRDIRHLSGSDLYEVLTGYRFTPREIEGIVTEYNLNVPPQLRGLPVAAEAGRVVVVSEGGISQPSHSGQVEVQRSALRGLDPDSVRERTVQPHDLATAKAQERAPIGSQLIISGAVHPTENSLVIVDTGTAQALAVWPIVADWVTPYTIGGPLSATTISKDAPIVAVVISVNVPQPFLAPTAS